MTRRDSIMSKRPPTFMTTSPPSKVQHIVPITPYSNDKARTDPANVDDDDNYNDDDDVDGDDDDNEDEDDDDDDDEHQGDDNDNNDIRHHIIQTILYKVPFLVSGCEDILIPTWRVPVDLTC